MSVTRPERVTARPRNKAGRPAGPRPPATTYGQLVVDESEAQKRRRILNAESAARPLFTDGLFIHPERCRKREQPRLNWRHPLALPTVLAIVLLSPFFITWAALVQAHFLIRRLRSKRLG